MAPSATSSGALKQYIEAQGLGLSAYRDNAAEGAVLPYVRIHEEITKTPRRSGDFGDQAAEVLVTEEVQLDLFQPYKNDSNAVVEVYPLTDQLVRKLHGAHLASFYTKRVAGVRVLNSTRFLNEDENVVRHLITVALDRAL